LRLWLLFSLLWVSHNFWWLSWVEVGVSSLDAVSDIDAAELSILGDGQSSWPSHRFDYVNCIAGGSFSSDFVVLLLVTADFALPSGIEAGDGYVFVDCLETLFNFIFFSELIHVFLLGVIFHTYWLSMGASADFKNNWESMGPVLKIFKIIC